MLFASILALEGVMEIHEHREGVTVRIVPRVGDSFCFESHILKPISKLSEGYILVEPMKNAEGKYLNFDGLPCVLEVEAEDSECVYRYKIRKMGYFQWKSKVYFVVYSDDDVGIYNRRLQYRLPFVSKGQLQVGRHTKIQNCYIHDISINGMSISVNGGTDFKCDVGINVTVSFERNSGQEVYKVEGTVVRVERKGVNTDFIGLGICITNPARVWTGFVSRLQREELQRKREERWSREESL